MALLVVAGCASSLEPQPTETADGLTVGVQVDTNTLNVGDWVSATMTISNTSSVSVERVYPPLNWGPVATSNSSALVEDGFDGSFFGEVLVGTDPHTLALSPGETVQHVFHFQATRKGTATIAACIPKTNSALVPTLCALTTITMLQQ